MTGQRSSFHRPLSALIPFAASIVVALLAIVPLHAQLPAGPACVAGNRPPVATADSATTYQATAVTITVLANDSDPDGNALTVASITQPTKGSAVINAGQTVTFTPPASFTGAVQFTYVVKDGAGGIDAGTVDVIVRLPPPVLALGFNEGLGTQVLDSSGRGNNGVISGAVWTAEGRYGGALAFDGVNDMVTIADSASLDLKRMTLEAWVKPNDSTGWRNLITKQLSSNTSEGLCYSLLANSGTDGGPGTYIRPSGWASDQHAATAKRLAVGEWHHVAGTYDEKVLRLYVDGVQVASLPVTTAITTSGLPLFIGGNKPYGNYFNGAIDDVRIYNFALTQDQIQADMTTPLP